MIKFSEVYENGELIELFELYEKECKLTSLPAIKLDLERVKQLEEANIWHSTFIHHGNRIVGFGVILVSPTIKYSCNQAFTEGIYVHRDYRQYGYGATLLRDLEDLAREQGCDHLFVTAPTEGRFNHLLEHKKDYKKSSVVYSKVLTDD